jgi:hypothetical protein
MKKSKSKPRKLPAARSAGRLNRGSNVAENETFRQGRSSGSHE